MSGVTTVEDLVKSAEYLYHPFQLPPKSYDLRMQLLHITPKRKLIQKCRCKVTIGGKEALEGGIEYLCWDLPSKGNTIEQLIDHARENRKTEAELIPNQETKVALFLSMKDDKLSVLLPNLEQGVALKVDDKHHAIPLDLDFLYEGGRLRGGSYHVNLAYSPWRRLKQLCQSAKAPLP